MVKVDFLKKYLKPLALLILIIILSMLLFSSVNTSTIENLTPIGPVIDVMLWTNNTGSLNNTFVTNDWFELINTYKDFPNINFGQQKVSEIAKYLEPEKNTHFQGWTEASTMPYIPCVTIIVVDRGIKSLMGAGAATGGFFTAATQTLTLPLVKYALANVFSKNYDKMYNNNLLNVRTSVPATPVASAASAASATSSAAGAASAASAARAVNLSNFFNS